MPEIVGRLRTPRLTGPPSSPAPGEMYYDTGTNKLYWWDGAQWIPATLPGAGLPSGGAINQVLAKKSATDYDTQWVAQSGGGSGTNSELSYTEVTSSIPITATTEAAATTLITAPALVFDGATPLYLDFFCPETPEHTTAQHMWWVLYQDGVSIGILSHSQFGDAAIFGAIISRRLVPSAGTHTYSVRAYKAGSTGTPAANCGPGGSGQLSPMWLRLSTPTGLGGQGPQGPPGVGSAGVVVGANIAALPASPVDGLRAQLRLPNDFDRMDLVYDSVLGKWVSDTKSWSSGTADATSNAASYTWNFQLQRNGNSQGTMMHGPILPWAVWDAAGLKPQFRFTYSVFNGGGTNPWTGVRRYACAYNAGDTHNADGTPRSTVNDELTPTGITQYTLANIAVAQGDVPGVPWRDLNPSTAADVRDLIIPMLGVFSNISPAITTGRVYNMTFFWRWISK